MVGASTREEATCVYASPALLSTQATQPAYPSTSASLGTTVSPRGKSEKTENPPRVPRGCHLHLSHPRTSLVQMQTRLRGRRLLMRAGLSGGLPERGSLRRARQMLLHLGLPGALHCCHPKLDLNCHLCVSTCQGAHCEEDINECLLGSAVHQCGDDSRCVNR